LVLEEKNIETLRQDKRWLAPGITAAVIVVAALDDPDGNSLE
jgi:hypothetical protein